MIEENPANPIFLAPFKPVEGKWQFAFENRRSFPPDSVNHSAGASLVVVKLGGGPLKETVVIQQLEPPEDLPLTAGKQRAKVVGTQKSVAMNMLEDFPVAVGQTERGDFRGSFETGESDRTHALILP